MPIRDKNQTKMAKSFVFGTEKCSSSEEYCSNQDNDLTVRCLTRPPFHLWSPFLISKKGRDQYLKFYVLLVLSTRYIIQVSRITYCSDVRVHVIRIVKDDNHGRTKSSVVGRRLSVLNFEAKKLKNLMIVYKK